MNPSCTVSSNISQIPLLFEQKRFVQISHYCLYFAIFRHILSLYGNHFCKYTNFSYFSGLQPFSLQTSDIVTYNYNFGDIILKLKTKRLLPSKFQSNLLYWVIFFSFINIVNSLWFHITLITLVESQILYTFSALAQVVGALLGLTIAGYSIIDSKLKSIGESDSTVTDYAEDLRSDYFSSMIIIIILSAVDIISCICILCIYNNIFNLLAPFLR